jgi:cobalt transporter subunit CbtB
MHTSVALPVCGTRAWPIANRLPAFVVLLLGMIVLYAVGFSTVPQAHNSAHDMRHANGFPCH